MRLLPFVAPVLAVALAVSTTPAKGAAAPADPPELVTARTQYDNALKPMQQKVNMAIKVRAAKYAADVHEAERQAVGEGKLDSLKLMHAEYEIYAAGGGSIGFAENDPKVSPALLELRRIYERDVLKIRLDEAVAAKPTFDTYLQSLEDLEKKFVAARDPDGVLAVQKEIQVTRPTSIDPLKRGAAALLGDWIDQSGAKFTFHEDGTLSTSVDTHAKWTWEDASKGKLRVVWDGGNKGHIEYQVLPDGLAMVGHNHKGEPKSLVRTK